MRSSNTESEVTQRLLKIIRQMSDEEQEGLLRDLEEKQSSAEHRRDLRKPFFMVVDYETEDHRYNDFIQDISASGVFIETCMSFSVGQDISLIFTLPREHKTLRLEGEVVRTSPQGIGVKFKTAGKQKEAIIKTLMESS